MALPPLEAGAVQETLAWALPAVALALVGAADTVTGVTLLEAADAGLLPTALVAVTVKLTGVPLVRPEKVVLVAGAATLTLVPVLEVTV